MCCLLALSVVAGACGDDGSGEAEAEDTSSEEAADASATTESPDATESSDTTEAGADGASWDDAMAEYTSCLEDEGFEMGDIPEGMDLGTLEEASPEVQLEMGLEPGVAEAHVECWTVVEDAIAAGATPPEGSAPPTTADPELAQQMSDAVACLNDRGWDFLEPGVEAGPLEMAPRESGFDWDDAGFLQDQRECQQQAGMMVP